MLIYSLVYLSTPSHLFDHAAMLTHHAGPRLARCPRAGCLTATTFTAIRPMPMLRRRNTSTTSSRRRSEIRARAIESHRHILLKICSAIVPPLTLTLLQSSLAQEQERYIRLLERDLDVVREELRQAEYACVLWRHAMTCRPTPCPGVTWCRIWIDRCRLWRTSSTARRPESGS